MDEIDLQEQVGKGGFGAVYKGTWRGAIVAVKHAICNVEDAESLEQSIREVVLSKKLSHPNVVQTYAWTVLTGADAAGVVSLQCQTCTMVLDQQADPVSMKAFQAYPGFPNGQCADTWRMLR